MTVSPLASPSTDTAPIPVARSVPRPRTGTLVVRGVLSLVVGAIALSNPGITVSAVVLVFAVYAFVNGAMELVRAFRSEGVGSVVGRVVLAVLNVVAGVGALAWPGITAFVLVLWVASWALATGVLDVVLALRAGRTSGERGLLLLAGLLSVVFGVVLVLRPEMGALALAQLYGLFSLVTGVSLLVAAFSMRSEIRAEARKRYARQSWRRGGA